MNLPHVSIDPIWAPVIAALGASLLTILGTMGIERYREHRARRDAQRREKDAAYQEVLSRSLAFANRSRALGDVMRLRSGIAEGLSVTLGQRRPADAFEIYEWIDKDFGPLLSAWSRVWVVGTQQAIDAADRILDACGDVMGAATDRSSRGPVMRAYRALAGEVWTKEQLDKYDSALQRLAHERVAFVKVMRAEIGKESVELALERANRDAYEAAGGGSTTDANDSPGRHDGAQTAS